MTVNEIQFGCVHERGNIDTVFILRIMQDECHSKGKTLYMCFVDLAKAFEVYQEKCRN